MATKKASTHKPTKAELAAQVSQLQSQLEKDSAKQHHWGRSIATGLLVLIASWLFVTAINTFWLRQTLFDTDTWVAKTSEIMQSSSVQHDIAVKAIDSVFTSVDVEKYVSDLLPDKAKPLAGTITSSLQNLSQQQTEKLLASDQFQNFWKNANKTAHTQLLKTIATANQKSQASAQDEVIFIDQDRIILNVQPILQDIKSALASSGLGFVNNINTSSINLKVPLATVKNLPTALMVINTFNGLAYWLPILALLAAALALWVSRHKRKTILQIAIVSAVILILNLVTVNFAGYAFSTSLNQSVPAISTSSAQVIYTVLTKDLLQYDKIALALMLLIALFAYLTGTSTAANWIRNELAGLFSGQAKTPAVKWLGTYAYAIVGIMIALTAMILVFAPFRSAPLILILTIIVGVLSILLLAIRAAALNTAKKSPHSK